MKRVISVFVAALLLLTGCSGSVEQQGVGTDLIGYFDIPKVLTFYDGAEDYIHYNDLDDSNRYNQYIAAEYYNLVDDFDEEVVATFREDFEVSYKDIFINGFIGTTETGQDVGYSLDKNVAVELDGIKGKKYGFEIEDDHDFYGYLIALHGEKDDEDAPVLRIYYFESLKPAADAAVKAFEDSFHLDK